MNCPNDINGGITCRATVRRMYRRPKVAIRCDETIEWWTERLAVGIEALGTKMIRESARADFYETALKWALGDGPLPIDEEAEYAACLWYSIWLADDDADERLAESFARIRPFMTNALVEVPLEAPTMRWSEVVGRLALAVSMRHAWKFVNDAQRAIVEGNAIMALDKLEDAARCILLGQDELDAARETLLSEA
jgi:hypothetical protein